MGCGHNIYTYNKRWLMLFGSSLRFMYEKVIGYSFAKTMYAELVVAALNDSYVKQRTEKGSVIFHSNLGTQYTSNNFIKILKKYEIIQSHSIIMRINKFLIIYINGELMK